MEKYNGWESRALIDCFMRYCRTVFDRYRDKVRYWLTFNEINIGTLPFGAVLTMAAAGIRKGALQRLRVEVKCYLSDPRTAALAEEKGITRTQAGIRLV